MLAPTRIFSALAVNWLIACALPGGARAAIPCSDGSNAYPSFCDIPAAPTDARGASGFKTVVVDTRLAGAGLVRETTPAHFSLDQSDAFEAAARRQVMAPPPMTPPGGADTAAFVKAARARARPPSRPR